MVFNPAPAKAAFEERVKTMRDSDVKGHDSSALWPIGVPDLKRTLQGHIRKIQGFSWSADSSKIIASDQGGKIIIWDVKSGMKLKIMDRTFIMCCALHPTEPRAFIGGMDNTIHIYDTSAPGVECKLIKQLAVHDGYVGSLVFQNADKLLSSGGDAAVLLWDVTKLKEPLLTFLGHEGDALSVRFPREPGSNSFVTCSTDTTMRVWDVRSGKCTHLFNCTGEVNSCAFFPSGQAVVGGCHNGEALLFDLRSANQLQKYARKGARVSGVDFSKSGRVLYCAYEDGHVGLWDTFGTGGYKAKLDAHFSSNAGTRRIISAVSLSPDGTALATGAYDALIKVWGPPPAAA